jgi:hypothetical protein
MRRLDIFPITFGRPDLLRHQVRLLGKHLRDPYEVCVIDNTPDPGAGRMEVTARSLNVGYQRAVSEKREHNDALNFAAKFADSIGSSYWAVLDHDIFPVEDTRLLPMLDQLGFWGLGQWHAATNSRYLWPGFASFKREWLAGRVPNFNGIRGQFKRDDGDCGSMLSALFTPDDWARFDKVPQRHGYENIRPPDEIGLQSFGVEYISSAWLHLTNASNWMLVPDAAGRDRILREKLEAL